jgi:hypothetical protein
MKNGTRIALGLAGGYLLGRYRKARWLMLLAGGAAATRAAGSRMQQSESSAELLSKLAEQGQEVAAAIVGSRMEGITQRIHDTTESLRQAVGGPEAPSEGEGAGEAGESPSESDEQPEGRAEEESAQQEEPEKTEGRAEEEEQPDEPQGEAETEQKDEQQAEQQDEQKAEQAEQKDDQKGARQPAKKGGQQRATASPGSRRPESRRRAVEPGAGRRRTSTRSGQSQE